MDYEQDEQEEQYEEVQAEPQAEALEIDEEQSGWTDITLEQSYEYWSSW